MNRLAEVGRVTPCAPFFALQESVVAAVGAQRTARPTFRFLDSFPGSATAHWDHEHAESPSPALRAPSPPLGERDGVRGFGSWKVSTSSKLRIRTMNRVGRELARE